MSDVERFEEPRAMSPVDEAMEMVRQTAERVRALGSAAAVAARERESELGQQRRVQVVHEKVGTEFSKAVSGFLCSLPAPVATAKGPRFITKDIEALRLIEYATWWTDEQTQVESRARNSERTYDEQLKEQAAYYLIGQRVATSPPLAGNGPLTLLFARAGGAVVDNLRVLTATTWPLYYDRISELSTQKLSRSPSTMTLLRDYHYNQTMRDYSLGVPGRNLRARTESGPEAICHLLTEPKSESGPKLSRNESVREQQLAVID